jgi:hypothetical protein
MVRDLVSSWLLRCSLLNLPFQNHLLGSYSFFFRFRHITDTFYNLGPFLVLFRHNVRAAANAFVGFNDLHELTFKEIVDLGVS